MSEQQLQQTPSQTIGPFFAYSLTAAQYNYNYNSIINGSLINDDAEGELIYITGCIFDGNGNTISDAMIELWQADATGNYITQYPNNSISRYPDNSISQYPNPPISQLPFKGFGRLGTGINNDHRFTFTTIKPGSINGNAPHINVILFMRGSLRTLFTRLYFSDEANDNDPLLNAVDAERRHTLIASKNIARENIHYQFDIHLQGERETVFFDV